ncbi:hypothetical protein CPB84DRAFT_1774646 [Gymnopilus junonius]|uniref:Uncharacterized protein n=1 Tax=Gymnopilus junonius TaxID=109634 RepID=A0A9P5TNJ3_GYMJU|nr:hypothetical protein CPB84DRAFT_1774646 [Gymnopilus junonius]
MNESIIAGNFLAVAFALKRGTLMKGMDGTLALGSQNIQSSHFQIDGKTVLSGPTTFIEAVQEIVKSGPDKLTNGISIYLCFIYHQPGKSTALLWGKWVIRLKYLILQEWLPSGWKDQKIIAHVGSSGQEEPIDVILDTGSSMSYLSPDMIEQMASLFNRRPTILNDEAPYFTIPDDFDLQNYRVKYIFEGMSKQHVTVTGNIRPFVYVNHNGVREGLLGPTKRMSVGVLGIKWFQTMIVGLFNSPQGNYVRLAQLTPDNHTLPTFE